MLPGLYDATDISSTRIVPLIYGSRDDHNSFTVIRDE